jgi:alpha-beta hydrolase superfamily lysophospholipase
MSVVSARLQPYESMLPYERVEFTTFDSTTLRGNLYRTAKAPTRAPIVIFVHGIGLLKEQYLENWFRHFLQGGYHVLTYDNRSFGQSDGLPRENFDWILQAEDFIDTVTYARSLGGVDPDKVFGWGVAHAGGLIAMQVVRPKFMISRAK